MRKAQKKLVLNFVRTLREAHDEIKRLTERKDVASVPELLRQCQQGAIEMGGLIEKTEGEDCDTIRLLEEYCEELYRLHSEVLQGIDKNRKAAYKKLYRMLLRIENSIKFEIRERLEAVFLPYKASMWDSLESVWRAADADEDCDAYVIPIPYYDKNPDGSLKKEHWEGEEYPDYVPITRYDVYNFEERHPDIIFIHNPYDDCNYVTSVQPFFYSGNLKKFTDQLVYIPYFVLEEISPQNQASIGGIKHLCIQPGVINADKVIVQSEDMRQVYVKVLTESVGGNREYWEEKILGLGSPKVDKALDTKKENLNIPEGWLEIIRKPDGSFKKVFFYNTSVTALLMHDEAMIEKMRDVFRIFKENQNEQALLWRPHPLLESTIKSMRPQLFLAYDKLKKQYQEESFGIYDDSVDLNRAIAVSDAYYGDESSVVQLFQEIGKPILIQEPSIFFDA